MARKIIYSENKTHAINDEKFYIGNNNNIRKCQKLLQQ